MKNYELQQENILGMNIKKHRSQLQMTQEYLAETLNVSRQAVSKWECGESEPSTANLILLSKLFNVSTDELLRFSENQNNKSHSRLMLLIMKHKILIVLTAILLVLSIVFCVLSICDNHYYSSIFYVTQSQMDNFIESNDGIEKYEIPSYPSLANETDKFVIACCNRYFVTTPIEHTRTTNVLFRDKNGRYLIMCFDTDKKYPAKQAFHDITDGNKTTEFKKPFISFYKSAYAEQYYMGNTNQAFMQFWFNGSQLVIMVSENKESAAQMIDKITSF